MVLFESVCYAALVSSYVWLAKSSIRNNYRKLRNGSLRTLLFGTQTYERVPYHWFFATTVENRVIWQPFSLIDSETLEDSLRSGNTRTPVSTDGGRYDVNIPRREMIAVYWSEPPTKVRRCSWFFNRNTFGRFVPYDETLAAILEIAYRTAFETCTWYQLITLPNGDCVSFHGPGNLILYEQASNNLNNVPLSETRSYPLRRGVDDFDIDVGETTKIDHLLFIVHGVGSVCDLKFRSNTVVVNEFRKKVQQCIQTHYQSACKGGVVHRIEVLPISWHETLHSEETGIDQCLKNITLDSIPLIREFTNDTLLDILFYTSPTYCQTIITFVGTEMNNLYNLFKKRNPLFSGGVSVVGHSLGSLILFDLLCHQHPEPKTEGNDGSEDNDEEAEGKSLRKRMSIIMIKARTQQPELHYPDLLFQPSVFFALGSPTGMFITIRGVNILGEDFALPTCNRFLNIFHPNDPVAYRIESLINPDLSQLQPVVIPHHKEEITQKFVKMGSNLRGKLTISSPLSLMNEVATEVHDEQLSKNEAEENAKLSFGVINSGRRIDFALQQGPLGFLNEYLSAVTSHFSYWNSQDTMLMIAREVYSSDGITPDEDEYVESMEFRKIMEVKEPCSSQATM